MPYISGKKLLDHAYQNGYAVGAFSAHNVETLQAILGAAEEEQSPVMVMIGQKVIQHIGLKPMKEMIDIFIKNISVPVAVHLDHSRQFEQTMEAVQAGFQSVMFDGSGLPFEENVSITKKVAEIARALNIGCEGEIGKIGGTEDDITVAEEDAMLTTVEEAYAFATAAEVDYLAVSIGTAHGIYKRPPKLAIERLKDISEKVNRPIVLHGGSDVPDGQIKLAILNGVAKINVDTELRQAFTRGIQATYAENPEEYHLAVSLGHAREEMKFKVKEKINLFGSAGKAEEFLSKKVVTL
ncbi:class II fructose-bisphosphate aldolase [Scopulibacillus cellulosilyticus]|uniref:Ketose-bisphosphate aldolase n=1 Tax=Scopulibacillus cellulosilyticus TaxID=2665665 RepID=A0ABW2PW76_9BACL